MARTNARTFLLPAIGSSLVIAALTVGTEVVSPRMFGQQSMEDALDTDPQLGLQTGPFFSQSFLLQAFRDVPTKRVRTSSEALRSGHEARRLEWKQDWSDIAAEPVQLDVFWNDSRRPWPRRSECEIASELLGLGGLRRDLSERGRGNCAFSSEPPRLVHAVRRYRAQCGRELLVVTRYELPNDEIAEGIDLAAASGLALNPVTSLDPKQHARMQRALRAVNGNQAAKSLAHLGSVLPTPSCGTSIAAMGRHVLVLCAGLSVFVILAAVPLHHRSFVACDVSSLADSPIDSLARSRRLAVCESEETVRMSLMDGLREHGQEASAYRNVDELLDDAEAILPAVILVRVDSLAELQRLRSKLDRRQGTPTLVAVLPEASVAGKDVQSLPDRILIRERFRMDQLLEVLRGTV